ncbi:MAG TPA: hypothetical protein VK846_12960 [Candidatus Limnocylindria bacterium]|nr:hypothetical protein [Candidatus Limnocylindria bacterium]
MDDLIKSQGSQLGSIVLLIGFMFWTIKENNKRAQEDRERMDKFVDRVFSLAQDLQDAALQLSADVKRLKIQRGND